MSWFCLTPFSNKAISLKPGVTASGTVPVPYDFPQVTWTSGSTMLHRDQFSRITSTATAAELEVQFC